MDDNVKQLGILILPKKFHLHFPVPRKNNN